MTPAFEVRPSVQWDTDGKVWYAATALVVHGVQQQAEVWTQFSFSNMRRAKQFARTIAAAQEQHIKRTLLNELIAAGTLLAGKGAE